MYSFCENVFYVKGAVNACLYDLNNKKLYRFSDLECSLLDKLVGSEEGELELTKLEKAAVEQLQALKLVQISSNLNRGMTVPGTSPAIKQVWLEVTQGCNLRCLHCYENAGPVCRDEMSLKDFQHCISELAETHVPAIQFIGGEPLCLKSKLKTMIEYCLGKFSSIEVFTNGTLITEDWADFFAANNIKVALSVYSYIPTMHDYVTKHTGSFDKTTRGIRWLRERNVKYRVANVLMDKVELGERNTDLFRLNPEKDIIRMSGRGNLGLLNEELLRKRLITPKNFEEPLKPSLVRQAFAYHQCFSTRLYIDVKLNVYPCVMERRICHGSLKNSHLKDVLRSDIFTFNKDRIEECRECEFRYCCFDCRPNTLTDNIAAKPWYCSYLPRQGRWQSPEELIQQILQNKAQ